MQMSEQRKIELMNEKLSHYNKWLGDAKRPLTQVYPGFPKQKELDVLCGLTVAAPAAKTKKVRTSAPAGGTKLDAARKLFATNKSLSRAAVIALFMTELSMSKAGATTYFYNVQK